MQSILYLSKTRHVWLNGLERRKYSVPRFQDKTLSRKNHPFGMGFRIMALFHASTSSEIDGEIHFIEVHQQRFHHLVG
ncbi:hypothetical protein L3Y34_011778 [Caenorhabditis briggsae]|uniref:Uncharacterized protein n=1 Tax=Caenorhabditis briggsae TaxID=6238 RepID=A0AAE8ZX65_CAEBR|nr:hypothetical protein L3Y34_011778 [Caenorhabditis briggsae]